MKRIFTLLLCPLAIMAMEHQDASTGKRRSLERTMEEQHDKKYVGVTTYLVNTFRDGRGYGCVSPCAQNTLIHEIYKHPIVINNWITDYVASIDDVTPSEPTRSISTGGEQYKVYIDQLQLSVPDYNEATVTYTVTRSAHGQPPQVVEYNPHYGGQPYSPIKMGIGYCWAHYLSHGKSSLGVCEAKLKVTNGKRALDLGECFSAIELPHDPMLEKNPNRGVALVMAYLRMNKLTDESGKVIYVPAEKQDLE